MMLLTGDRMYDVMAAPQLVEDIVSCAVIADRVYDSNEFP
jgi:hypothetical protein